MEAGRPSRSSATDAASAVASSHDPHQRRGLTSPMAYQQHHPPAAQQPPHQQQAASAFRPLEAQLPQQHHYLPPLTEPGRHASRAEAQQPTPGDVWSGAIARLQTQVSYNTGLAQSNRRDVERLDGAIARIHDELQRVYVVLEDLRADLRAKPSAAARSLASATGEQLQGFDPGDVEVLAEQIQTVTNKANEVDGLKMQVELMKRRVKRIEEGGTPSTYAARPATSSSLPPDQLQYEAAFRSEQALPPMQAPSEPISPSHQRGPSLSSKPPFPPPQGPPVFDPAREPRAAYTEPSPGRFPTQPGAQAQPPPPASAFSYRASDPPPPPPPGSGPGAASAAPSWRQYQLAPGHSQILPAPTLGRHPSDPESGANSWTAVNPPLKRPPEGPSPFQSPSAGSPKRPRLAPIMPRGGPGDESSHLPTPMPPVSGAVASIEPGAQHQRSRAPSNDSQSQHSILPTPASATGQPLHFLPPNQSEMQSIWRPQSDLQGPVFQTIGTSGRPSRGGNKRGGGRGRRSTRGGGYAGEVLDMRVTPEWEREKDQHALPPPAAGAPLNGRLPSLHPISPISARIGMPPLTNIPPGSQPLYLHQHPAHYGEQHDFPVTPVQGGAQNDTFTIHQEGAGPGLSMPTSGGKKTRTKPVRNSEGILIRKDGRPDMRSVSSANNLRKVHAKKEAERAGGGVSTRSFSEQLEDPDGGGAGGDEIMPGSGRPRRLRSEEHQEGAEYYADEDDDEYEEHDDVEGVEEEHEQMATGQTEGDNPSNPAPVGRRDGGVGGGEATDPAGWRAAPPPKSWYQSSEGKSSPAGAPEAYRAGVVHEHSPAAGTGGSEQQQQLQRPPSVQPPGSQPTQTMPVATMSKTKEIEAEDHVAENLDQQHRYLEHNPHEQETAATARIPSPRQDSGIVPTGRKD